MNSITKRQDGERLREEIREHIALETAENLQAGMPPAEARRRALVKFGAVEAMKEDYRSERRFLLLDTLLRDMRYALRMLRKSPGFTAVAVLTLALGIGANTAIFSLIDAVMLRSVPVRDPHPLVVFEWANHRPFINGEYSAFSDCGKSGGSASSGCSFPLPIFKELHSRTDAFAGVFACAGPANLDLGGNGPPTVVDGEIVSGDYFSTLGVATAMGRTLGPADDSVSAAPAAVLSYSYWQSAFGGSPSVLGRTIRLNNVAFTIVGVAERTFTSLSPGKTQDLWLTISMVPRLEIDWGHGIDTLENWWLLVMARLKPGVSLQQAQAAASLTFRNELLYGPKPYAKAADDPEVLLTLAEDALIGKRGQLSAILYLLASSVGVILLIACANVAGLLLSRASTRQKEVAVRLTLGARRAKILRQLLTESIVLSLLGGFFGVVFAYWGVHAIARLVTAGSARAFPYALAPDWRVLLFTLSVCILTGMAFGIVPAFRSLRLDLTPALKESAPTLPSSASGPGRFQFGSALVVIQVALSMVVLVGAGLLVRTLENLRSLHPGFDARNILLFEIDPGQLGYKPAQMNHLFTALRERLAALPGVRSVSYSGAALLNGGHWFETVHFQGQPAEPGIKMNLFAAGPGFFDAMHIPLVEGRMFTSTDFEQAARNDAAAESPDRNANRLAEGLGLVGATPAAPVNVLVNQAFVRRYFPAQNPLGKPIFAGGGESGADGAWGTDTASSHWQVVGVVADTKYDTLRHEIEPVVYLPFTSAYGGYFELRTAVDPRTLIPAVRSAGSQLDSNLPLNGMSTETEQIDELLSQERMVAQISAFFAALALLLACIGLYGLVSYEVSRRTREIGVRIALGAHPRDIVRLVARQGITLVIVGALAGIAVALGVTRFLGSMLYGIHADDPLTLLVVTALLALVALVACYIPARRAIGVDPMVALRHE